MVTTLRCNIRGERLHSDELSFDHIPQNGDRILYGGEDYAVQRVYVIGHSYPDNLLTHVLTLVLSPVVTLRDQSPDTPGPVKGGSDSA